MLVSCDSGEIPRFDGLPVGRDIGAIWSRVADASMGRGSGRRPSLRRARGLVGLWGHRSDRGGCGCHRGRGGRDRGRECRECRVGRVGREGREGREF